MPAQVVRAAVVQEGTSAYSLFVTLDKLERFAAQAAADGAQLAVFPEALCVHVGLTTRFSIGGYPKFSTFYTTVGARAPEGREEFARYHAAAIEVPHSAAITRIEQVATANNLFTVVGVGERDGGTLTERV